ncbi:hypothetical protein CISG_01234 [Coccidioides immitis RMSCC 3703]|uniref:Uncharacterized protein n=2 Tax=Coccidioides immitis TaxID=5501 RepID=A0A0J8QVK3_COCIT|nr:hypothetical protein CIRG_01662 [Coccidioides immitis RMSCC 2394]KMU76501.1 hypothetical protein CISG_01234 [Coccidioides immitis RMSCC 3703]
MFAYAHVTDLVPLMASTGAMEGLWFSVSSIVIDGEICAWMQQRHLHPNLRLYCSRREYVEEKRYTWSTRYIDEIDPYDKMPIKDFYADLYIYGGHGDGRHYYPGSACITDKSRYSVRPRYINRSYAG